MTPDAPPLIEFRTVSKIYGSGAGEVRALDRVDLSIERGAFVAIMGPSGSGKSTALNIMGCLDVPSSGEYLFQGMQVGGLERDERTLLRRHMIGFVFQGFNLLARTSAIENVALPLIYKGMSERERMLRSSRSALRGESTTRRRSCPAASSSAWRSRAPSSRTRPCCSPTSPRAISTPASAARSWTSSRA